MQRARADPPPPLLHPSSSPHSSGPAAVLGFEEEEEVWRKVGPKSCLTAALHGLDHFSQRLCLADLLARAVCPSTMEGTRVIWGGHLAVRRDSPHLKGSTETTTDHGANRTAHKLLFTTSVSSVLSSNLHFNPTISALLSHLSFSNYSCRHFMPWTSFSFSC